MFHEAEHPGNWRYDERPSLPRPALDLKISLILPLFDRRNAGWNALESALRQSVARDRYEIIAVMGRPSGEEPASDAPADALLAACDAVVHIDADPCDPAQEIPFLLAGYERATGDALFFMEGHTVLADDCCAMIAAYFRECPQSQVAWAPRVHRSETPLGMLIGMHSKRHEQLARTRGGFWLGANSVITRELFERMGRLDTGYMRFCERVFQERLVRENVAIGRLPLPLATHYDDMPLSQLIGVAAAAGEAKFRYYNLPPACTGGSPVKVRHGIYLYANHDARALILYPLASVLGALLLRSAIVMCRFSRSWAYRLYVPGFGFADLAGFCKARLRAAHSHRLPRAPATEAGRPEPIEIA